MDSYTATQIIPLLFMIVGILILFACATAAIAGLLLGSYFETSEQSNNLTDQ